jgi:hypothetical protein
MKAAIEPLRARLQVEQEAAMIKAINVALRELE